jgi:GT2 family glycosyltransferase
MANYKKYMNVHYDNNSHVDYSIVMTYYKRYTQLNETLRSFNQYKNRKIEVIIVNDGPDEDLKYLINNYNFPILLIEMDLNFKNYYNPCIPFNVGFTYIKSPITIIQNAECLHYNDIISLGLNDTNSYQVFSCYSLSKVDTELYQKYKIVNFKNINAKNDGESAWYNHGIYRPSGYHFCSMISTANLRRLNGFDERFKFGIGFDDDEFLYRIKKCNFLKLIYNDQGIVIHQWHYSSGDTKNTTLINRNRFLFSFVTKRNFSYKLFLLLYKIKILNKTFIDYLFLFKDKFI